MHKRLIIVAACVAILSAAAIIWWAIWNPYPQTDARFDRGTNGLWVGHQWYSGLNVRTGEPVGPDERAELLHTLRRQRIGYLFVHAGPVRPDGSVNEEPTGFWFSLRADTPHVLMVPWLGAGTSTVALNSPAWRRSFIDTLLGLRAFEIHGVHLDFEPITDEEKGYVELLAEIRAAMGPDYFLSHATRRAGPWGISLGPMDGWFWSGDFYEATMQHANQTVLMAYDTTLDAEKNYVGFVRHQTELLLDWGCARQGHHVMIGIPSYEDMPHISNPEVETIHNAALGVRAALEGTGGSSPCFDGVAVYAEWVTDGQEWSHYRSTWLGVTN